MIAGVEWETPLSTGLAGVTALAALAALLYARQTVMAARKANADATRDHQQEMEERSRASETELRVHRIARAEAVLAVVIEIRDAAIDSVLGVKDPRYLFPALSSRLRLALSALQAIGGPSLSECVLLAEITPQSGTTAERVRDQAHRAMDAVEQALAESPEFRVP